MPADAGVLEAENWWPVGFVSEQEAELLSAVDSEGVRREVDVFIGGLRELHGGPQGKPQAFMVHMPPHDEVPAHFHRIDQFQVFFGASGARYQRTEVPQGAVLVQYADAYSTYGPFSSGDEKLNFFTLRAAGDGVTAYMPGSRDLLVHRGRRLTQVLVEVPGDGLPAGETGTDLLIGPDPDGAACYRIRGGAGTRIAGPSPVGSGGQCYCLIGGTAVWHGQQFGPRSVAWVARDGEPLTLDAGDGPGFDLLVLQWPATPSYPIPDPISRS